MKTFKKGKWVLTHERETDFMGFEVDRFTLFDSEKRVNIPFIGFPKVSKKGKDFPINKIPYNYTKKDYEEMLDKEVEHFSKSVIQ